MEDNFEKFVETAIRDNTILRAIRKITKRHDELLDSHIVAARLDELELIRWLYKENNDQSVDMKFVEAWTKRVEELRQQYKTGEGSE